MSEFESRLNNKLGLILQHHVAPIFKAGTRLTIIARTPDNNEADVLVSDDDIDSILALLERSKSRKPVSS